MRSQSSSLQENGNNPLDMTAMRNLVKSLPQYRFSCCGPVQFLEDAVSLLLDNCYSLHLATFHASQAKTSTVGFAARSLTPAKNHIRAQAHFRTFAWKAGNLCLSLRYREQLASLTVHVNILSKLNGLIDGHALVEMGKLEQDLVYGNATSKEVVTFLGYHQGIPPEEKVILISHAEVCEMCCCLFLQAERSPKIFQLPFHS